MDSRKPKPRTRNSNPGSRSPVTGSRNRRVILKLSGEVFGGKKRSGLDAGVLRRIAADVQATAAAGYQIGVVIGGGNFFRGGRNELALIERTTGDDIGMLATVMNALALRDVLRRLNVRARVLSALEIPKVAERYTVRRAAEYFAAGEVLIFAAGTGNPFFTTDTAAALRACELEAGLLLKATNVDGVYSGDPKKNPAARRFQRLSYEQCLRRRLGVMDLTAFELCAAARIPILVFNIQRRHAIVDVLADPALGTCIGA